MNKAQWRLLAIFFILMGAWFLFIFDSSVWEQTCHDAVLNFDVATTFDVFACIRAEIYTPFVWVFFPLGVVCFILGWLEPKKK